ncbi:hypothetical protein, partial [Klebsiella aerogenes]|uniref:hypothetical protein n=1 Tax=Klebsiella aerogenes TaxID=548 RepID=UPI0013D0B7D6
VYTLIDVQDAGGGCLNAASGSATVVINPQPIKAIISAVTTHLCNGLKGVIRIDNYQAGLSYTWYKDGLPFRTTSTDTLQVVVAGSYTVLAMSAQ